MINKTFSKCDMCDIIRAFNIDIPNYTSMDKSMLSMKLWDELCCIESIEPEQEVYCISTIADLKEYLTHKNPSKVLTVKEKSKVMNFCKEVIVYCNNGYSIDMSIFTTYEEIDIQLRDIAVHGDIPSVRRAVRLFNGDPKIKDHIHAVISNRVRRELEVKKKKKVKHYYGLIRKEGHYVVSFD
tara:strand:+ start:9441 stop:9989 length:549 start_codon:yes stop_codon:yes gene_type:complete